MKLNYIVSIENPRTHFVKVKMTIANLKHDTVFLFMPSWSPGSYLLREYSKNIRQLQASQKNGEILSSVQISKNMWKISWDESTLNKIQNDELEINYEVYCKELTVRTSHVDESHAFLHGPSYLLGVLDDSSLKKSSQKSFFPAQCEENIQIEFRFPALWSKLTTSLETVESEREKFLFQAPNYDELIDTPVEIGCHETDGMMVRGREHYLAFYGQTYPHPWPLKDHLSKIIETVASHFKGELPFKKYSFIVHFVPHLFGGLEHLSSTALQFDGRKLVQRKDYLNFLSLVAHEYFHLWNIKRIRPQELGPFDYTQENYTSMLWLAEGLTSFLDDLFVYRAGLSTLEEYLEIVKVQLQNYEAIPGRKYHSLEESSFNAWIKLYRADENFKNSSISYYLKGGLVFFALHCHLISKDKSIDDLLDLLWESYLKKPQIGLTKKNVYDMIQSIGGDDVLGSFIDMIETTEEIHFDKIFENIGLKIIRENENDGVSKNKILKSWIGVDFEFKNDRVFVKQVLLDSPAQKAGINAHDEILAINGLRFLKSDAEMISSLLMAEIAYEFTLSRSASILNLKLTPSSQPRSIKDIKIINESLIKEVLQQRNKHVRN